jgi:hypothetical protein
VTVDLRDAGIVVVASAGNGASQCDDDSGTRVFREGVAAPACLPEVISVGTTDTADNISSFSQSGALLDLLAPGQNID